MSISRYLAITMRIPHDLDSCSYNCCLPVRIHVFMTSNNIYVLHVLTLFVRLLANLQDGTNKGIVSYIETNLTMMFHEYQFFQMEYCFAIPDKFRTLYAESKSFEGFWILHPSILTALKHSCFFSPKYSLTSFHLIVITTRYNYQVSCLKLRQI